MTEFSDRTFGVEIECGYDNSSEGDFDDRYSRWESERPEEPCGSCRDCTVRQYGDDESQTAVEYYGIEDCVVYRNWEDEAPCDCGDCSYDQGGELSHALEMLAANGLPYFDGCYDGTTIEVKTPVLRGAEGAEILRRSMVVLKDNGAYVTQEDGLHVHHGGEEFIRDTKAQVRLVESWVNNEPLIEQFVKGYRIDSWCCHKTFSTDHVREYKHALRNGMHPEVRESRGALNVGALHHHGTVEFRLHEGTLDELEALSWVKFGQAFMDRVAGLSQAMGKHSSCKNLLSTLGITGEFRDQLLGKAGEPQTVQIAGWDF